MSVGAVMRWATESLQRRPSVADPPRPPGHRGHQEQPRRRRGAVPPLREVPRGEDGDRYTAERGPPPHARRGAQSSCRPSEVPVPVSRRMRRGCRPATLSQTQQIARIRAAPPDPPPPPRRNSARGPPAHPSSSRRPAAVRSPRAPPRGQTPALLTAAKIVRRAGGRGPARPADFGQRPRLARPRRRAGTRHRRAPATASPSARCGPPPGASGRWRGRPAAQEAARPRHRRAGAAAAQRRRRLPLAAQTLPPLRCVHTQGRPALGAIGGANQGGQRGRIGWGLMGGGVPPIAH